MQPMRRETGRPNYRDELFELIRARSFGRGKIMLASGREMAPQAPRRSARPGVAVAALDHRWRRAGGRRQASCGGRRAAMQAATAEPAMATAAVANAIW